MRPDVHEVTEDVYSSLGSGVTRGDEGTNWHLLRFLDILAARMGQVSDLVVDGVAAGWASVLSVDDTPVGQLPYLSQFVGARVDRNLSEADQRASVRSVKGWARGTVGSIREAAEATLIGSRTVRIYERNGSAWQIRVVTYLAETPDAAAVEAAIRDVIPVGNVLTYAAVAAGTYAEAAAAFATYNAAAAYFATYDDSADWAPGEEI